MADPFGRRQIAQDIRCDGSVLDWLSIEDQSVAAQLDGIARNAHHALDEALAIMRRVKYHDVSSFGFAPFGNAPRFDGMTRSFRTFRTNIAVAKAIRIRENVHGDLRLDVFDLFNQKTWSNPGSSDLSSNQFGIITNANGNRNMQLGLKLVF